MPIQPMRHWLTREDDRVLRHSPGFYYWCGLPTYMQWSSKGWNRIQLLSVFGNYSPTDLVAKRESTLYGVALLTGCIEDKKTKQNMYVWFQCKVHPAYSNFKLRISLFYIWLDPPNWKAPTQKQKMKVQATTSCTALRERLLANIPNSPNLTFSRNGLAVN